MTVAAPATTTEGMRGLKGKNVLVTGGTSGIGQAIAVRFAEYGANVAINYLRRPDEAADTEEKVHACVASVRQMGVRDVLVQGDVSKEEDVVRMFEDAVDQLGGLDVLVNNAGVYPRVSFLEMRETDWDLVLDVNLKGGFFCAQAAARAMIAGGRRGAIIHMASQAIRGAVRGVHYSASKGGVVAMTRAMALELAEHGIRVNAIAPGLTDTAQPRYGHGEEELAAMARAVPLGRMAQPDDIASVAVFLASDEARYVTGQTMHVNGGSYMP